MINTDYENDIWPFTSDDIGDYYVYRRDRNILEESTSCRNENLKEAREGVTSESDWKRYYEFDDLKRDIREIGKESFKREILSSTQHLEK